MTFPSSSVTRSSSPYEKTSEGQLIRAVTLTLNAIIKKILEDPTRLFEIDPRKWEEIIAVTYDESCEFDEVNTDPSQRRPWPRRYRREEGIRFRAADRVREKV